jgi:plastocyanin
MSRLGRRLAASGCALVLAALAVGVGRPGALGVRAATTTTVAMESFAFSPTSVTIHAGDTVTWTYNEKTTDVGCESPVFQTVPGVMCPGHSATASTNGPDGKPLFDSGVHRAAGFPYSHTFVTPGTFHYICVIHGGAHANNPVTHMEGDVIVQAAPAGTGTGSSTPAPTAAPTPVPNEIGAFPTGTTAITAPVTGAGISAAGGLLVAAGTGLVVAGRVRRGRSRNRARRRRRHRWG